MKEAEERFLNHPETMRQQFFKLWNQWVNSLKGPTLSGEKTHGGDDKYNESAWALSGYPWLWSGGPCLGGENSSLMRMRAGFVKHLNGWIENDEGELLFPIYLDNGHEFWPEDDVFKVEDCWSNPWKRNDHGFMQGMYPHNIYPRADNEHSLQQIKGFSFWLWRRADGALVEWENYTALQQAYWQRTGIQPFQQPNNIIHRFAIGNGEFIEIQRNDHSYGTDYDVWRPGERPDMSDDMDTDDFFKMMSAKILENEEKFKKTKTLPLEKSPPPLVCPLSEHLNIHCECGQRWEENWLQCSNCGKEWHDEGAPPFIQNKLITEQKEQNRRRARKTKVRRKAEHWRPPRPTYGYDWRSKAQRDWDDAWVEDDEWGAKKLTEEWRKARDFMKYNILQGNKIFTFEFPNGIKIKRDRYGCGREAWDGPLNEWILGDETFTQLLDKSKNTNDHVSITVDWDKINEVRETIKQREGWAAANEMRREAAKLATGSTQCGGGGSRRARKRRVRKRRTQKKRARRRRHTT